MSATTSHAMHRLPQITFFFWVMKICATTLGETAGDLMSMTLNIGYAASTLVLFGAFGVALAAQLRARAHHPFIYWSVILATSTAGTTMSDFMDRTLGLGYTTGSMILLATLLGILLLWRRLEGTISVSNIVSFRGEVLYWGAILVSNTLGTALGDFLADDSGLGFLGGALLIGGCLGLVLLVHRFTRVPTTALFWIAFVLTRPFGATVGDVLTKGPDRGGLGFGTVGSSLVLLGTLIGVILYTMRRDRKRRIDVAPPGGNPVPPHADPTGVVTPTTSEQSITRCAS